MIFLKVSCLRHSNGVTTRQKCLLSAAAVAILRQFGIYVTKYFFR
nr:MAG TPA: hypothetical protein [Caudoviricetes sp.]